MAAWRRRRLDSGLASTEPRSRERGRIPRPQVPEPSCCWLQRGRARMSAEGGPVHLNLPVMNWLQRGRTHVGAETSSSRPGNMAWGQLQRGRARGSAEGQPHSQGGVCVSQLQRGRAHVGAEGSVWPSRQITGSTCFNGAPFTWGEAELSRCQRAVRKLEFAPGQCRSEFTAPAQTGRDQSGFHPPNGIRSPKPVKRPRPTTNGPTTWRRKITSA